MSTKTAKNTLLYLVTSLVLGIQPLQAANLVPSTQNEAVSSLANKILLLEKEILLIKAQQEKIEALSKNILKIERDLGSLQNYVRQDTARGNYSRAAIDSGRKQNKKTNFFVPAGW